MLKRDARAIVGGLSEPGKMPGFATSIHPKYSNVGSKLRLTEGSVCWDCYACKGNYYYPCVQNALERRYQIVNRVLESGRGSEPWLEFRAAMQTLLRNEKWFRVHDAGDLISASHLRLWCDVADDNPHCGFWMPSKELAVILLLSGRIPDNLCVRYSAPMIDKTTRAFPVNSATFRKGTKIPRHAFACLAAEQGNACGDCRACWDSTVATVVYPKH